MAQVDRRGWINGVVNDEEGRPIPQGEYRLGLNPRQYREER